MQRYESGSIKTIKYELICKMAELFNCGPAVLMGWDSSVHSNNNNSGTIIHGGNASAVNNTNIYNNGLSEQEQDLLKIYRSVTPKGQVYLMGYAYEVEKKYSRKGSAKYEQ